MDTSRLKFLTEILNKNVGEDLKMMALQELLSFTGNEDLEFLIGDPQLGKFLTEGLKDESETVCKTACLCLVNVSATDYGTSYLLNEPVSNKEDMIRELLRHALNADTTVSDAACMTLSNLTRVFEIATFTFEYMKKGGIQVEALVHAFVNINYNNKGCHLHYLAPLISNLTQISEFRRDLMNREKNLIRKLLPFTHYRSSIVRRGGIIATLKNCCFESSYHQWLLEPNVDILPFLLLPLAGPEQFTEEENDKLPVDLQYLDKYKKREDDCEIRRMLLESLNQLCATRFGREYLRSKNTYLILREYHKWEKHRALLLICENVVNILLRTEEEINEDNLKDLEIPEEIIRKFEEMDRESDEDMDDDYVDYWGRGNDKKDKGNDKEADKGNDEEVNKGDGKEVDKGDDKEVDKGNDEEVNKGDGKEVDKGDDKETDKGNDEEVKKGDDKETDKGNNEG